VKSLTDISSVWLATVVSAPLLWSMVLHLPVTCADLKICTINVSENGSSGVKIRLYDYLSVSLVMIVGIGAEGRVQSSLSQFRQVRTTCRFSNHSSSKKQTGTTLFTLQ